MKQITPHFFIPTRNIEKMQISTDTLWSVVLELIQSGDLSTMPFPAIAAPSIGDVICFESKDQMTDPSCDGWVYVQITGIFHHYRRGVSAPSQGLVLAAFMVLENLGSIVIE